MTADKILVKSQYVMFCSIWCHLYNLKKREKQPWRIVTFSKVADFLTATLLKVTLLHGCFSLFLKLYKWYQITQIITYFDYWKTDLGCKISETAQVYVW